MAKGVTLDFDFDITKAEAKQRKLQREFNQALDKLNLIRQKIAQTTEEIEKSKQAQAGYNRVLDETADKLDNAAHGLISLSDSQKEALKSQNAEAFAELQKQKAAQKELEDALQKQTLQFKKQDRAAANVADKIKLASASTGKFSSKFQGAEKSMQRLGKRISSLIASALFFSVITKAFTALRQQFSQLLNKEGSRTAELIAEIKGNLSTIGMTLYESARPYIEWLLQKLAVFTDLLSNGIAKLLGKNVNQMKKLAKQTKKTGEEAKKATASFDTIQVADGGDTQGKSGGISDNTKKQTGDTLADLYGMLIVGAALLVLGVILTFTGANIPLGLALIVAGALMIAAPLAEKWDKLPADVKNTIAVIWGIGSLLLLLLGIILTFTGANIPLGIGLIILGVVGLVTLATVMWNSLPEKTKSTISGIMGIGGAIFILLGLVLILTGVGIPLGIGLIFFGAGLLYGALKLTPGDTFLEKVKNLWTNCKNIIKNFIDWFSAKVLNGIFGKGFGESLKGMFNSACEVFENIVSFFKNVFAGNWKEAAADFVNIFISAINFFINKINAVVQFFLGGGAKLINAVGKLMGFDWNLDASGLRIPTIPKYVPKLVTGAVLPGGSPMLAMVNDQPKGKPYLEGSVENIAAAFDKYLGNRNFAGTQNINIKATGSMAQLIRYLKLAIDDEDTRVHA